MTDLTFRPGVLPNDPSKARLRLGDFLTGAPIIPPPAADWDAKVVSWPMYGNDQYGDCVWAMIGHAIQMWTANAGTELDVPLASLLKGYSDVTGFNPADPSTDQGTVIQDALNYWRKTGIVATDGTVHKILAFAQVDISNPAEVEAATALFGNVLFGIRFPKIAMDQFNAGQPWDAVAHDGGIEGGHAILTGKYAVSAQVLWAIITWAREQGMTAAFFAKYLSEAWIAIAPEWVAANGHSPSGLDLHGLGAALAQLTGAPNPFPPNPPGPVAGFPGALVAAAQALGSSPAVATFLSHHHLGQNAEVVARIRAVLAAPLA